MAGKVGRPKDEAPMEELVLKYKYVIKAKKRPQVNFRTRGIRNPSAEDEHAIEHDTKIQLTNDQIKKVYDSKYVSIEVVNYYKTSQSKLIGTPKTTKPDCDNYIKLWCDSLNGIMWKDDGQIYKMTGRKYWADKSYAIVTITYGGNYE